MTYSTIQLMLQEKVCKRKSVINGWIQGQQKVIRIRFEQYYPTDIFGASYLQSTNTVTVTKSHPVSS